MTIGGILLLMLDRKEASQELFLSCGGTGTAGQVHGAGPQGVPFEVCDCKTHTHSVYCKYAATNYYFSFRNASFFSRTAFNLTQRGADYCDPQKSNLVLQLFPCFIKSTNIFQLTRLYQGGL